MALVFAVAVEDDFDFASPEYAALYRASSATAFQHPAWLAELYGRLTAANDAVPLIVVVRHAADRSLAAVLPLVRRRYGMLNVVEFADLRVSDYAAVVADARTFTAIVAGGRTRRQILRAIGSHDVLRIGKLMDGALPINRLFGIARSRPMRTNSYAVPLEADFGNWRERHLDRSYAKELAKKLRQLERKGAVQFAQVTDDTELRTTFEAMKAFRRDRFELNGGGELLQVPAYFEFYLAVARRQGLARTYRLTVDGRIVATALGLAHKGAFLVILSGFTQTEFKNKSLGSLLFEQIARDCIAHGEAVLDFTIGDEPYKRTFGAQPSPMWQMSRAGSALGLVASTLVERLPSAKALARNLFDRRNGTTPRGGPHGGTPAVLEQPTIATDQPALGA
jgi:CelD/BcsL family acetyltransferase involved in cellulose biosynthesis